MSLLSKEQLAVFHPLMVDDRGVRRTTSLFFEARKDTTPEAEFRPIFTLKERDHTVGSETYVSLKEIYMSYNHVPGFEYKFALDVFGTWDHWLKVVRSSIRNDIQQWRDELDIKLKSEAIRHMISASKDNDAKGIAAARYLAEKGYLSKSTRGRPSKEELERTKKQEVEVQRNLAEDMERLGIKVVAKGT